MPKEDFLQRINSIEWEKFPFPICCTPRYIGDLFLKNSISPMDSLCSSIESCVLPQSCLCEATPLAIPFLLEIANYGMSCSCIYDLFLSMLSAIQYNEEDSLSKLCKEEIYKGTSTFVASAVDRLQDESIRYYAIRVLARIPERKSLWQDTLQSCLEEESNETIANEIREVLNEVMSLTHAYQKDTE